MKQLFLLVKAGLMNQWKLDEIKHSKDKKKKNNAVLMWCAYAILGIVLIVYAAGAAYGMIFMGIGDLIPGAAVCGVSIITLFFTILQTNGILFGYKDYDMLASLPVKTNTLVASRFIQLYLINLVLSLLVMAPMGIVMGILLHKGFVFYFMWIIAVPVTPLIPTTIAAVIGTVIMWISARMKHANAVSAVISLLLITAIMAFSMGIGTLKDNSQSFQLDKIKDQLETGLVKAYPVSGLFQSSIIRENWIALAVFVLGSYLWYRLFTGVTALKYGSIQTMLKSHKVSEVKKGALSYESRGVLKALMAKEWKRFLNSNIYLLNMGCGVLLLLLAVIAMFLADTSQIEAFFASEGQSLHLGAVLVYLIPFVIGGISGMSCLTSCSLSMEGSNINILKSLPLEPITIYSSKIAVNLCVLIPATLLSSLLMSIRFANGIFEILIMFLLPLSFNLFTACFGMLINIRMPNFSWENEAIVVKQSMPSFLGIFGALLVAFVCGTVALSVPANVRLMVMAVITVFILGLTVLLFQKITKCPLPADN